MIEDQDILAPPPIEVVTNASVILADGSSVTVGVRVLFTGVASSAALIQGAILSFFHGSGAGSDLTLADLKSNPSHIGDLVRDLRNLKNVSNAEVTSLMATSPPSESFRDKSVEVTAIIATGETIRLKFATPTKGTLPPPSTVDVEKAFELLKTLSFSQLDGIKKLLNASLLPANPGWQYLILGLEMIACPCHRV